MFWHVQSKAVQIQTVKIFWQSNIPLSLRSFLVSSFYKSFSVRNGRRSLEVRDWCEFFTVQTGVTRNLQAVRYIFSFYSCDKKVIKVNVKPTFYCSRPQVMGINTCLIYRCLSSASTVIRSWFIYELQKSTTIAYSRNSLYTFYSRNPTCGIPPWLRISSHKYPPPPMPPEFHNHEPPLPFGNPKSCPWYRYGYLLESPILSLLCWFQSILFNARHELRFGHVFETYNIESHLLNHFNQSKEIMALNVPDVLLFMIVY